MVVSRETENSFRKKMNYKKSVSRETRKTKFIINRVNYERSLVVFL